MTVEIDHLGIKHMALDPHGPVAHILEIRAYQVETLAKVICKLPGTGRIYGPGEYFLTRGNKVYHWKRTTMHQASAPGEPPAGDTGYLAASISHEVVKAGDTLVANVRAKANYGIYLELGTRYMKPRPFLRPSLSAAMKVK